MRLKNSAHFIGIIRGNFIELRDYDNIQDLKDGTKIIIFIFTPTLEEQKAFKKKSSQYSKAQLNPSCNQNCNPKLIVSKEFQTFSNQTF